VDWNTRRASAVSSSVSTNQHDQRRERPVIRLFEVLEVEDGLRTLGARDLGGARPKQVLEILLAARGHRVSTDRLAELLRCLHYDWTAAPMNVLNSCRC
jgi:hypothetical protein